MDSRSLGKSISVPHSKTVNSPPFLQREINIHHITTLWLLPLTITCCTQLQASATDPRHAQSVSRLSSPVRSDRALHLAKRLISLDPYQEINRTSFKSPSSSDRLLIESYLLEIQIAYRSTAHRRGSAVNRRADPVVCATAAVIACHGFVDVFIRGRGVRRKECSCRHNLSGLTIPALGDILFDPLFLQRM